MAYDEKLASRIRKRLSGLPDVEEKKMMGGLTFMVNGKMCVGIFKNEMMCRIDRAIEQTLLAKKGCRSMELAGRPMKGYVLVEQSAMKTAEAFDYWINCCLDFNKFAKSSKKKK